MPLLSISLVVAAALIHATWNLFVKRAAAAGPTFVFFHNVFASALYLPWIVWSLATQAHSWTLSIIFCLIISAVIHLVYSLCLQRGYQVADLSIVYPVARGTAPMLSFFGALVVLRESPSAYSICGAVLVVSAVALISVRNNVASHRTNTTTGAFWGASTGSLIAGYTVLDGYGVKVLGIQPVMLEWSSNLIRVAMMLPIMVSRRSRIAESMKGRWLLALGAGAFSPLSYILVLTAVELGAPLSTIAPARELSMMFGTLYGFLLLREPIGASRVLGCFGLTIGVILLVTA